MRLLLRKIAVFLIAAGLTFSGAASPAHATMASAAPDAPLHEMQQVQLYADLAIDAGEDDCLHATGDAPAQHQHDDGLCKKCCAACTTASLIPDAPMPILVLSQTRKTYAMTRVALAAHAMPTDPGIPKSL